VIGTGRCNSTGLLLSGRLRLDRLIAKIRITDNADIHSEFERILRAQHAEGRIDAETLKTLLAAHQKDLERTRRDTRTA
jgi:hypothetical protein